MKLKCLENCIDKLRSVSDVSTNPCTKMSQVFIEFLYAQFTFIWLVSWVESREYTKDVEISSPTSTRYFLSALFTSMCTVFLSILCFSTPNIPVYRRENYTKRPVNLMQIKPKFVFQHGNLYS